MRSCPGRTAFLKRNIRLRNRARATPSATCRISRSRRNTRPNLQAVISAMGDMQQPADRVGWEHIGTLGTGVLVSDTMMFQRFGPDASDSQLGHFYGLALPLLMRGLPVEPVQIETAQLDRYKTLLLSYEGQKPPKPEFHDALAAWVKAGGALIVVDNDRDPFNKVREWWNTGDMHYATPRHHLFDKLGIDHDVTGQHQVGQGIVTFLNRSPSGLSRKRDGAEQVRARRSRRDGANRSNMDGNLSDGSSPRAVHCCRRARCRRRYQTHHAKGPIHPAL